MRMEAFTLIGFKTIYKQKFTVMAKMLLISDEDLKSLIQEAVTNAVDGITKKIASRAARIYNNQIFRESRREDDYLSCGAGDSGGCGSSDDDDYGYGGCGGGYDYSYGGCGSAIPSDGGCGSAIPSRSSRSSGGCGGGYESGGC